MASYPLVGRSVGRSVGSLIGRLVSRLVGESSFSFCQLLIPSMLSPNPHSFIRRRYAIPTCPSAIVTTTTSSRHLPLALAKVDRCPFVPVLIHCTLSQPPLSLFHLSAMIMI